MNFQMFMDGFHIPDINIDVLLSIITFFSFLLFLMCHAAVN